MTDASHPGYKLEADEQFEAPMLVLLRKRVRRTEPLSWIEMAKLQRRPFGEADDVRAVPRRTARLNVPCP